jgi:protein-disulfide isomerase
MRIAVLGTGRMGGIRASVLAAHPDVETVLIGGSDSVRAEALANKVGGRGGGRAGRFWQMHDHLYEHQRHLEDADLHGYAEQLGLDVETFDNELAAHVHVQRVREDFVSGVRSGVNGTPTFYINGIRQEHARNRDRRLALAGSAPAASSPFR